MAIFGANSITTKFLAVQVSQNWYFLTNAPALIMPRSTFSRFCTSRSLKRCFSCWVIVQLESTPIVAINTNANYRKTKLWPFILTAVVASAVVWLFQSLLKENPISKIPLVGDDIKDEGKRRMAFAKGAKHVYRAGYRTFKNGLFRVSSPRGMKADFP